MQWSLIFYLAIAGASPLKTGLVGWTTYRAWAPSKRIAYVREARRVVARFEAPHPMAMTDCLTGGTLLDSIPGTNVCPTTGNGCEGVDDGFTCGLIYDAACVSRTPVASLTARCEAESVDRDLTRPEFEARRAVYADVQRRCEDSAFGIRNAENCELFEVRLAHLNAKFTGADDRGADAIVASFLAPPIAPPPAISCRGEPYRIVRDPGGLVQTYVDLAERLRASEQKVEIRGSCDSACLLLIAKVPRERVCVAPGARLGFHQARDVVTGRVDHAFTAAVVAKHYSPELKQMWSDHYSDSTALNRVNYPELTRYYATCGDADDVCSPVYQVHAALGPDEDTTSATD